MKKHFTYSLICILLSLVVYSCRKEVESPGFKEVDPSDLAQYAEKWLYKNSPVSKSGGGFVEGKQGVYYKPKWENLLIDNNNRYQVAEFDITELGQATTLLPDTYDRFRECSDSIYLSSYTRYVYMIDKETGRDRGFLMTIVPELEYMEDTNFEPLDVNGYLKRDYRLSGLVLFYDIDGTFVNGWVYKNGKITATTQPISRELAEWRMQQREETKGKNNPGATCTEYYTVDYTDICYYSTPERRPQDLISCHTVIDDYYTWEMCEDDSGGGGGIGGTSGSEDTDKESDEKTLKPIFKNSNLDPIQIQKVNDALDALEDMCGSKWLIETISGAGVSMVSSKPPGNARGWYSTGSGSISLNPNTFGDLPELFMHTLTQEMFHAYQDKIYYQWGGSTNAGAFEQQHGRTNLEFEAYTFANLMFGYAKGQNDSDAFRPPFTDTSGWVDEYANTMSKMTEQYTKQITGEQLDELYKMFHTNFSEYYNISDSDIPKLDALKNAISEGVNYGDCYMLK